MDETDQDSSSDGALTSFDNIFELPNLVTAALSEVIAAASSPGTPKELAGEERARSAFRAEASLWPKRTRLQARMPAAIVATSVCLLLATGGLAAATNFPAPAAKAIDHMLSQVGVTITAQRTPASRVSPVPRGLSTDLPTRTTTATTAGTGSPQKSRAYLGCSGEAPCRQKSSRSHAPDSALSQNPGGRALGSPATGAADPVGPPETTQTQSTAPQTVDASTVQAPGGAGTVQASSGSGGARSGNTGNGGASVTTGNGHGKGNATGTAAGAASGTTNGPGGTTGPGGTRGGNQLSSSAKRGTALTGKGRGSGTSHGSGGGPPPVTHGGGPIGGAGRSGPARQRSGRTGDASRYRGGSRLIPTGSSPARAIPRAAGSH
jgi:hypothetical protein